MVRSLGLLDKVVETGVLGLLQTFEALPGSVVPRDVAADHFIRSFLNLIEWWLAHDMPYQHERMDEIYHALILRPVAAVALRPRLSSEPE